MVPYPHGVGPLRWPIIRPGQMTAENILGPLVPLECNERNDKEVSLAHGDESSMKRIRLCS